MEGGGVCDKYLLYNFDNILDYKLQLLKEVVAENPDIIVGDFNSVYAYSSKCQTLFLEEQCNYFSKLYNQEVESILRDRVVKWNLSPYQLLVAAGYSYAQPINEEYAITSKKGNSIVDCVWYKKKLLRLKKCEILNSIRNCSDHNPVRAEFSRI